MKRQQGDMSSSSASKRARSRRGGRRGGRGSGHRSGERGNYSELVMENEAFESYYRAQGLMPEAEWDAFMAALRRPLPTTWRVNATSPVASAILHKLRPDDCFGLHDEARRERLVLPGGARACPPRAIAWYEPAGHAFETGMGKRDLRALTAAVPELAPFREFLIAMNTAGGINRQEAVSMIPPLLLDVEPHHRVLDMCAAPGSKTSQIVSALHGNLVGNEQLRAAPPTGFVMANDSDTKRAYLLSHQLKRLCSGAYAITNHDARQFPATYLPAAAADVPRLLREAARAAGENEAGLDGLPADRVETVRQFLGEPAPFHRVLADVPCSGDATLRKNPELWRRWNDGMGPSLHALQTQIAARGVQLLATGGIMVYSTCSLNPIENEAVVAALLARFAGALEVVDVSDRLPGLRRRPGLLSWRVRHAGTWYSSRDEVPAGTPAYSSGGTAPSLFPPAGGEEAARALGLHRCLRVLPQDQDTGGFFICVLRKTADVDGEGPSAARRARRALFLARGGGTSGVEGDDEVAAAADGHLERAVSASTYSAVPDADMEQVRAFFGMPGPADMPAGRLVVRADGSAERMQLLSTGLAEVLLAPQNSRLRVVGGGVRVFDNVRGRTSECDARLTQEGINTMLPFVRSAQLVRASLDDVCLLLRKETLRLDDLPEQLAADVRRARAGSMVVALRDGVADFPVAVACWVATKSIVCMVSKAERASILSSLSSALGVDLGEAESVQARLQKEREAEEKGGKAEVEEEE